jgi:hypothetical protein
MSKTYYLGNVAGLKVSAHASVLPAYALLWMLLGGIGYWLLNFPPLQALTGGLVCALLHFFAEFWHNLGHAAAARNTGHPMSGVRYWGFLASSIYPPGEGQLPAQVHIRRALGGPAASLILALAAGVLVIVIRPAGGAAWWIALFFFLDNLLVFTLGALLPLGFTDGSTLLYWLKKKQTT